ncbi:nucleotidyltransferase [Paenibacillus campi]|uniref:nucleotidyltransferase n=1 Tax=Paenibacillus campi TaxID=3106031 RepID=UPI002AFE418A|nr:nucleotidyltransferase [Paenibacillus sp. SGZ-1009]
MNIAGIIVEYNPFHNGHQLHLHRTQQLTKCDGIVAVMSGSFTQRGEPASFNKWARAEMALHAGCDVVLELPSAYAVQPAEWFAYGAVAVLEATGIVNQLVFGSESGALERLEPLAQLLEQQPPELHTALREQLSYGLSYPAALSRAALASGLLSAETAALLHEPNNTLGLQYIRALRQLGSRIIPLTIQREQSGYHDTQPTHEQIASATALRQMLLQEPLRVSNYVPSATLDIMQREMAAGRGPVQMDSLWLPLLHTIATSSPTVLAQYYDMNEGIEHRLKRLLPTLEQPTVSMLIDRLKTKRYTRARLQRLLAHLLLSHRRELLNEPMLRRGPGYLRVLGFTERGRTLLKRMKSTATLPIMMRAADSEHEQMELDVQATVMQAAGFTTPQMRDMYADYYYAPVRVE